MEDKKTAAQLIAEFYEKKQEPITPFEFVKEGSHKDYDNNLELCINHYKKIYPGDFYIEKRVQHEWALGGVPQTFMKGRLTCPTPRPLQTAIKFHRKEEAIEYLWTLPSKQQMAMAKVAGRIENDPDKLLKLKYIEAYDNGSLLHMAKLLNGELGPKKKTFAMNKRGKL